mmetsp:Transcript_171051/g.548138  ORF Transcript_171051/g.548138 Transcript_171051/m.548138 type:complete len:256 (-) Transcript_171051:407-1174(-)
MAAWVVVTGGGSGIGRGLVQHFSQTHPVLTCGRRLEALEETRRAAPRPDAVTIVACDIGTAEGRLALLSALPEDVPVRLLVQNAAIGDPGPLLQLDVAHFEEAMRVNVVAPLALTQALLPRLKSGAGRILHMGTSVAHNPQHGTATYGVTKAAFHRLYQQLNAEHLGVAVGSLSPGLVDTEGVRDHVQKARSLELGHVKFFDQAFENGWTTDMAQLMTFVEELVAMDEQQFTSKEWRFSEWRKQCELRQALASSI